MELGTEWYRSESAAPAGYHWWAERRDGLCWGGLLACELVADSVVEFVGHNHRVSYCREHAERRASDNYLTRILPHPSYTDVPDTEASLWD